jgi:hypothetical protein
MGSSLHQPDNRVQLQRRRALLPRELMHSACCRWPEPKVCPDFQPFERHAAIVEIP